MALGYWLGLRARKPLPRWGVFTDGTRLVWRSRGKREAVRVARRINDARPYHANLALVHRIYPVRPHGDS